MKGRVISSPWGAGRKYVYYSTHIRERKRKGHVYGQPNNGGNIRYELSFLPPLLSSPGSMSCFGSFVFDIVRFKQLAYDGGRRPMKKGNFFKKGYRPEMFLFRKKKKKKFYFFYLFVLNKDRDDHVGRQISSVGFRRCQL